MNTSRHARVGVGAAAVTALAMGLLSPTGAASARAPEITIKAPAHFSPNGDGVKDRAVIHYTLSRASDDVVFRIRFQGTNNDVRVLYLGSKKAGEYTYTWDGRQGNGPIAPDTTYVIDVEAAYPRGPVSAKKRIVVDRRFYASASVERFGAEASEPNRVFPRSTALVDALPIYVRGERALARGQLIVKDHAGKVVFRRDLGGQMPRTVRWTGKKDSKPLPVGRYRVFVKGVDKAGNKGRSDTVTMRVVPEKLVWREETLTFPASETPFMDADLCEWAFTGNECPVYQYCGQIVPSELFVGGLSHRSAVCPPELSWYLSEARSWHLLSRPEAVHGINRARVAFAGSPTYAGETDAGTLNVFGTTVTSSSGGQTPWITGANLFNGRVASESPDIDRIPPSVFWVFSTSGDDAFDVQSFTVDLRYAVID